MPMRLPPSSPNANHRGAAARCRAAARCCAAPASWAWPPRALRTRWNPRAPVVLTSPGSCAAPTTARLPASTCPCSNAAADQLQHAHALVRAGPAVHRPAAARRAACGRRPGHAAARAGTQRLPRRHPVRRRAALRPHRRAAARRRTPMPVRDKGPLFVIYPFDAQPELRNAIYYSRSAWQLRSIEVRDRRPGPGPGTLAVAGVIALVSATALLAGVVLLQAAAAAAAQRSALHQGSETCVSCRCTARRPNTCSCASSGSVRWTPARRWTCARCAALRHLGRPRGHAARRHAARRMALAAQPRLDDTLRRVDAFVQKPTPCWPRAADAAGRRAALAALHARSCWRWATRSTSWRCRPRTAPSGDQTERNLVRSHYRVTLGLTPCWRCWCWPLPGLSLRQMRSCAAPRRAAGADRRPAPGRAAPPRPPARPRALPGQHEPRDPHAVPGPAGHAVDAARHRAGPRQIDYLRTATESADHLLAVLNDILDMSQLEAGRLQLHPAPVDLLRALLRDVEALMRPAGAGPTAGAACSTPTPRCRRARLDATRVKQVLFNLLSNAIKFSDRGSVVLDLRVHAGRRRPARTAGGRHRHRRGHGRATLARLFHRFERGDTALPRRPAAPGWGWRSRAAWRA
jgi:hypothetical protein